MTSWYIIHDPDATAIAGQGVWPRRYKLGKRLVRAWSHCLDGLYDREMWAYSSRTAANNRVRAIKQAAEKFGMAFQLADVRVVSRKELYEWLGLSDPSPDADAPAPAKRSVRSATSRRKQIRAFGKALAPSRPDYHPIVL